VTRRAIVTGGAGFIGSHLVELLVDRDWQVLVVDDLSSGQMEHISAARRRGDVAVHVMDVRGREFAEVAVRFDPEIIFHLAAQSKVRSSVEDPVHDADVNVLGTINVLEAAQAARVRRVVFASSGGAIYGGRARLPASERSTMKPESPYGISKKIVADYFRWFGEVYGVEHVLLAPANVYGPRQDPGLEGGVTAIFAKAMLGGERPVIYGDGSQTRDLVYVEDVVDAFWRATESGDGLLLNIGSGNETSVIDLYDLLARITGFGKRPRFEAPRTGDVARSVVNPAKAKAVLGWEAWTPLEAGLRRTVEWYRRSLDR